MLFRPTSCLLNAAKPWSILSISSYLDLVLEMREGEQGAKAPSTWMQTKNGLHVHKTTIWMSSERKATTNAENL